MDRHPALGGGFGPGYKVAGGYDFVGNGNGGPKIPDNDPDDQQGITLPLTEFTFD